MVLANHDEHVRASGQGPVVRIESRHAGMPYPDGHAPEAQHARLGAAIYHCRQPTNDSRRRSCARYISRLEGGLHTRFPGEAVSPNRTREGLTPKRPYLGLVDSNWASAEHATPRERFGDSDALACSCVLRAVCCAIGSLWAERRHGLMGPSMRAAKKSACWFRRLAAMGCDPLRCRSDRTPRPVRCCAWHLSALALEVRAGPLVRATQYFGRC